MRDAITSALTLDIFHRNCDLVKMACVAWTVNVLNALILTQGKQTILTPDYDVFLMYKVHRGARQLVMTQKGPDNRLYVFASDKGDEIYVNANMTENQTVELTLTAEAEAVSTETLASDEVTAYNTAKNPNRIRKAASVNVLTFKKQPEGQ